jgi:hypothetical protein
MISKQYYIASLWDKHWVAVSDELKSELLESELILIQEDNNASIYRFNNLEKEYTIMYSTPEYVSQVNRITDFSYRVEVMVNGQYVLAREHQKEALIQYVLTQNPNIEVPHSIRGIFRGTFSKLDYDHFQYITENNDNVQMRRIAIL